MEHTTYASRLRYLDAGDVDDAAVDYEGLDVRDPSGGKVGDLDGFIVDAQAGRVYYVVVDAGGWFSSRRLLLPVGHARLDTDARALQVDVTRDTLSRYPEFDEDRFREFSDEDLRQFESRMVSACCPGEAIDDAAVRSWAYDTRRHYKQPGWWERGDYSRERLRPVETPVSRTMATNATVPPPAGAPRERVVAHERARGESSRHDDPSPHLDGRAQPGDVLGIETGGERTGIGDTAEDENERRRDAERTARDRRDDEPRRG